MSARVAALLLLAALGLSAPLAYGQAWAQRRGVSDDELRRAIINNSIARWGDCPCPYSYAWNGRQCAENSAYMKRVPNGPYCYPQDVPHWLMNQYRREGRG